MIPLRLKINNVTKDLWEIMEPSVDYSQMSEEEKIAFAIQHNMFPTDVKVTSEVYCRDAERTANYELENITNVNAKAKPEFTWSLIKADYVKNLLDFLGFKYNYKDVNENIQPEAAPVIEVTYWDFNGMRTIKAYLGQSIEGDLREYVTEEIDTQTVTIEKVRTLYWENFRIAFPER